MATSNVVPVNPTNQFLNLGKPVTGNTGVANPNNNVAPVSTGITPIAMPVGANNGGIISGNPATGTSITPGTGLIPAPGVAPTPVANPTSASSVPVSSEESKQLTDIYGKGTGGLLASEISNLGSNDSSYMEAYKQAMAGTNAENLATLNTTLGNEGISADSSTAAIENADFMSSVTAQEGLQEKQLQMNDLAQLLGLTESTMTDSAKEVASGGVMSILGDIFNGAEQLDPGLFKLGGNKNGALPEVDGSGGDDPLGLNSPKTMDLSKLSDMGSLASLGMI